MDYVVWEAYFGETYCVLTTLMAVDKDWELDEGISRGNSFPGDAYFEMDPNFKKQIKLSDILKNNNRLKCISKRLKKFLEKKEVKMVEFYPVKIINHKGKVASEDYFILNPLVVQDILDLKKSKIIWNPVNKNSIVKCKNPVFDEDRIDSKISTVWRLKYKENRIFIHKTLAEEMEKEGFTNNEFTTPEDYKIK